MSIDYDYGTLRIKEPKDTLDSIASVLPSVGISRLADITDLDIIGIPVYIASRPAASMLQSSSGKGVTHLHAKCSALMEGIEFFHAEVPLHSRVINTSFQDISSLCPRSVVHPSDLGLDFSPFFNEQLRCKWTQASCLLTSETFSLPADAVYFQDQGFVSTNTNGLASGNSLSEATLHALLELIERHCYSSIVVDGRVAFRKLGRRIDLNTLNSPMLMDLARRIESVGINLFLISLPCSFRPHVFWAGIIDTVHLNVFHFGLGCHLNPLIAASRAITEAVQSRLVFIHASREDVLHKGFYKDSSASLLPTLRYFNSLPCYPWGDLFANTPAADSLISVDEALESLLSNLRESISAPLYFHDLSHPLLSIPVVKVISPSLLCKSSILG